MTSLQWIGLAIAVLVTLAGIFWTWVVFITNATRGAMGSPPESWWPIVAVWIAVGLLWLVWARS